MKVTEFSVRHNMAVVVLCVGVLLVGSSSYVDMPRESFPEVDTPFIIVTSVLDGANPTDVEQSLTIPLETELEGVEGVKEMRSISSDSMSMISMEFLPDVDTQVALGRVRDAVDQAKGDISDEAEEPTVKEFSFSSLPILIYHVIGRGRIARSELNDLSEKLQDELEQIPGVLDVDIFGGREREIVIEANPERLHFYDLTLSQVKAILTGTNHNVSAGVADSATARIVMRVPGELENPGEILDLVIGVSPAGTPIYIRDVATARYDFEDARSRARFYDCLDAEGRSLQTAPTANPSVSLEIKKRSGANMLTLCDEVEKLIERYRAAGTISIIKGLDQSKDVRIMVADLENGIGTALILVLAVIFIGLGGRNAILVAAAIPFSMLISITFLHLTGETLNMMVLFSLILALGMLVDNAIVIVENIYRHYSLGASRLDAALTGTSEVAWPVITSTATTVGAFFPLVFWPGIMGQFMSFLPRTVIVVLISSLFVALVINPTLASMLMRRPSRATPVRDTESQRPDYWLVLRYQRVLEFMLDRPAWTLSTAFAMLVLVFALYGVAGSGVELFPPLDPDRVTCSIKPPEGLSLDGSDVLSRLMEDRILGAQGSGYDRPVSNLKHGGVVVGLEDGQGGGFGQENLGPVRTQFEFVDREDRAESSLATLNEMRRRVAGLAPDGSRLTLPLFGAEFDVVQVQEGPPTGKPVSIDIFGEDLGEMTRVVDDMKRIMSTTPGTVKPTDDAVTAQPTLEWIVDRARAGVLGLDQSTVGSALEMAVGGIEVGNSGHGDDEQDIILRFPERYRLDTRLLNTFTIPTLAGGEVPLVSVASARLVPGPVTIRHYNARRILNASCEVLPGIRDDAGIRNAFQERVADYPFPTGITHRFGGAAQEQEEASEFLSRAFMIALFIILTVMVLQFNSLAVSGIVMCSVILSLMGVFSGLLILQAPFGIIMTGIGVISLAGIVVNNAIVLLDAVRQWERRGEPPRDAVISASMIRFRPVLLTAITTILGLTPMALRFSIDFRSLAFQFDTTSSQWWQSMALSVIFGLLVATVLTLGVVPTLYVAYARARNRLGLSAPAA